MDWHTQQDSPQQLRTGHAGEAERRPARWCVSTCIFLWQTAPALADQFFCVNQFMCITSWMLTALAGFTENEANTSLCCNIITLLTELTVISPTDEEHGKTDPSSGTFQDSFQVACFPPSCYTATFKTPSLTTQQAAHYRDISRCFACLKVWQAMEGIQTNRTYWDVYPVAVFFLC